LGFGVSVDVDVRDAQNRGRWFASRRQSPEEDSACCTVLVAVGSPTALRLLMLRDGAGLAVCPHCIHRSSLTAELPGQMMARDPPGSPGEIGTDEARMLAGGQGPPTTTQGPASLLRVTDARPDPPLHDHAAAEGVVATSG